MPVWMDGIVSAIVGPKLFPSFREKTWGRGKECAVDCAGIEEDTVSRVGVREFILNLSARLNSVDTFPDTSSNFDPTMYPDPAEVSWAVYRDFVRSAFRPFGAAPESLRLAGRPELAFRSSRRLDLSPAHRAT